MTSSHQFRTYTRAESVVFLKTNESFGGLSNMAGGYPIRVNGIRILTSEALYQACRFPHLPDVQRMIIGENSPMTAKMRSKPYRKDSRCDWDHVRVRIMRWCLRMKLASNWSAFSDLLLKTGDRPIVEESRKDDFWGAKGSYDGSLLVGMNVLGRLLMELREQMTELGRDGFLRVELPPVPDFLLLGRPIETWALTAVPQVVQDTTASQFGLFGNDTSIDSTESIFPATALAAAGAGERLSDVDSLAAEPDLEVETPSCPTESESLTGAYPTYRESGLPWVPQIPDGWQVQRNGRLFSHRVETGYPDLPILEVSLRTGVRVRDMVNGKRKQVMSAKEKYKRAVKGDIAYNMMRMWQGAVGPVPTDGLVSPAYVVIRPHAGVNTAYFSYLFRTASYMQEVNKFSRGIVADRNRLYWESFKQMPSLIPDLGTQDKIVAYLRVQDAHFGHFIKVKRELIALLNEQRSSTIDACVTQGINPAISDRSCEIDWLDSIPEHWSEVRIRQLAVSLQTGPFGSQLHASDYVDDGIPVINPSHLKYGTIVPDSRCTVDDETRGRLARHRLEVGDIIFARRGELGRCAPVLPEHAGWLCGTGSLRVRLRPESVNRDYLMHVLSNPRLRQHLRLRSVGSTMDNANTSTIGNIRVPLPPPEEQLEICTRITAECRPIDSAIQRALDEIDLVREYRLRLIADVVTGQVDVRAWQPGPDDQIAEEDLTALGDDDDNDTTEEETDGNDGYD